MNFFDGDKTHHLPLKRFMSPACGPLSSVPAIGWEAIQDTLLIFILFTTSLIFLLTDPVSVSIVPTLILSFIVFNIPLYALNGEAIITKSAPITDFFKFAEILLHNLFSF